MRTLAQFLGLLVFICLHFSLEALDYPDQDTLQVNLETFAKKGFREEFFLAGKLIEQKEPVLALESLKRAKALCPQEEEHALEHIDYALVQTHFLIGEYRKAIDTFQKSRLRYQGSNFSKDYTLLSMLYKSYEKLGDHQTAEKWLEKMIEVNASKSQSFLLAKAFSQKNWSFAENWIEKNPHLQALKEGLMQFRKELKSVKTAKWLSFLLPGAGYYYAGHTKSAWTSFLINGLLIAASTQCFMVRFYTLGILMGTFEAGWYIGGVLGAMKAVQKHNDHLFSHIEAKLDQLDLSSSKKESLLDETFN